MTNKQREALAALRDALKPFMELDGSMTLNRVETLLSVYVEGISDMQTLREHAEKTHGLSKSALSRMVSWWGEEAYLQFKTDADGNQVVPDRPDGMGFLKFTPDPRDYRRRDITITPEGENFGQALADRLTSGAAEFTHRWEAIEEEKEKVHG